MNEQISRKKRIVFLGTPLIAVPVLEKLAQKNDLFELVCIVSQPPTRALRGTDVVPVPVHKWALQANIPVLTPVDAKSHDFILELQRIAPDLCVTAAYGQVLSEEFLSIPAFGTLNIHPSLLPLYRGAAPVQRALEEGVKTTGVSIACTVRAMDAGPLVAQEIWQIDEEMTAPDLLKKLFERGAEKLIEILPAYFAGLISPKEQDHERATKAKKIKVEEGLLHPNENSALAIHNKVRAFAGWPGTRLMIQQGEEQVEVKILQTQFMPQVKAKTRDIIFSGESLELVCGDGSVLKILSLQAPGKRAVSARDFWNGLRSKSLCWM